jgi:hypothetical protein
MHGSFKMMVLMMVMMLAFMLAMPGHRGSPASHDSPVQAEQRQSGPAKPGEASMLPADQVDRDAIDL